MKVSEEFYCSGGCRGYFIVRLRLEIDGNYTIVCPNCDHEHFRKIKGGIITSDRHTTFGKGHTERIVVPKAAFSTDPILEDQHDYRSTAQVIPEGQRPSLWQRFFKRRQ